MCPNNEELGVDDSWKQQDIKTEKITTSQIEEMHSISGTYDALFSRRAMKYKSMGLKEKNLSEVDYKKLKHFQGENDPQIVQNSDIDE